MARRRIHTLQRAPAARSPHPPLLFIHGGYVDARCWDVHFLPFFAARGYECHALDLSGHGQSEGGSELDTLSLDDYLVDVLQVIEQLDRKPIVVGHSMGAFLAERVLEESRAEAGVLMSPVPPGGTLESAIRLFFQHPQFLGAVFQMSKGIFDTAALRLIKEVYFSPDTSDQVLGEFTRLVQPESLRAVCDLSLLFWRWPPRTPALPVLVVGGEADAVFPSYMTERVARRWRGELRIVPGAGHAMIVDQQWESCAAPVLAWLQQLTPQPVQPTSESAPALACPA